MNRFRDAETLLDRLFYALALALTLYEGISTFRIAQDLTRHYATLVFGTMLLSTLLALRNVLREAQVRSGPGVWIRLSLALFAGIGGAVSVGYIWLYAQRLQIDQPFLKDPDIFIGVVFLLALLVLNWFHWGTILTGVIGTVILYFFFGHLIRDPLFQHAPYDVAFVMSYMGMNGTEGAFAYLNDGLEKLYFLVLFAGVMIGAGLSPFVTEMGKAVGRHIRGGAAFPAIVGSTLEGMVMGAAVTNVVMSGKLTIPMMKRNGFRPEFAAAVEVAASTAGQIIPPVMGLAAFIMAALLNIPYVTVAAIAVIPSFLYMVGISIAVLIIAGRDGLPKLYDPFNRALVIRMLPTFVIPVTIVVVLLVAFYSPNYAGIFGVTAILVLCPFQGRFRPSLREFSQAVKEALEVLIQLCLLVVAIGPLAQTFMTTNLAGRASGLLIRVVPDEPLIVLAGAMVIALIVGMGLPTPAAYLLVALTLGHLLQQAGFEAIPAHFFIQFFAVFSAITPPVALASLAGAKIANASFVRTSIESLKLIGPTFFIPFAFIYHPALLQFPRVPLHALLPMGGVIGIMWVSCLVMFGFFRRPLNAVERVIFAAACVPGLVYLVRPEVFYLWVFLGATAVPTLWVLAGQAVRERARRRLAEAAGKGVAGED